GMPNCTGSCASYNPAAGDQFIFRGGDTWHFGNSSAAPYTGGTWNWTWSGSSGSPIYIGVDQTWYNSSVCGGSWCRPLLNADNPLTTSTTLSSCNYQVGSNNNIFVMNNLNYITFDNFEMLGLCQQSVNAPNGKDIYVWDCCTQNSTIEHLYMHGWTHVQFSCPGGTGHCFNTR